MFDHFVLWQKDILIKPYLMPKETTLTSTLRLIGDHFSSELTLHFRVLQKKIST
jgi:hypothetical protein